MAVFMPVRGDIDGYMAFLFPWSSARALIGMLTGLEPENWDMVGELESSAILEVGNIINSSYLNAIADICCDRHGGSSY
jgi:chemotaxis protein CheC